MIGRQRPLTGRQILGLMLGFFGLIIAVNGVFVYFAISSFSGVETPDAYTRGLAYNRVIEAAETQAALGWTVTLEQTAVVDQTTGLRVSVADRGGQPIEGLRVTAELRRPTHEGYDQKADLVAVGDGTYAGDIAVPLAGQWDAYIHAVRGDEERYTIKQRLWLK